MGGSAACAGKARWHGAIHVRALLQEGDHALDTVVKRSIMQWLAPIAGNCTTAGLTCLQKLWQDAKTFGRGGPVTRVHSRMIADVSLSASSQQQLDARHCTNSARTRKCC